jgi:outer membrane receptor for ferrienterochelin and colicin
MKPILMRAVACECLLLVLILLAAGAQKTAPDLTTLQIDDLMNVDVTSASKKEQKISTVAAAIFAITQEDIRQETQGGIATAVGGTLEHVAGMVRYGGKNGAHGSYRGFADGFEIGHFLTPDHENAEDDCYRFHGGLRADKDISAKGVSL